MDHDVKAVANVFYKLAGADGKYLTNLEYQKLVCTAQDMSLTALREPLFADWWSESGVGRIVPRLYGALPETGEIRRRLETRTPPIKEESSAWKVIRMAYIRCDYEWRHAQDTSGESGIKPATIGSSLQP